MEQLEDRTVLSTSIPLNGNSWTVVGPASVQGGLIPADTQLNSGRVTAIAAHPTDPNTIYAGTANGGVWKTTNGGGNWVPLTDTQVSLNIGAIGLAPSNSQVIYVGTGESNLNAPAGDSSTGKGIYRSTDGGQTWMLLGQLEFGGQRIIRIHVDAGNPNVAYVAVMGSNNTTGAGTNTGIWKTTDGGISWTNTTTALSTTDAYTDLVMDPSNSQILYCAIGTHIPLTPNAINGVFKTVDGGASWVRAGSDPTPGYQAGDFPRGDEDNDQGLIRLAISRSNPQVIYAGVVANGQSIFCTLDGNFYKLWRSTAGGAVGSWTIVMAQHIPLTAPGACPVPALPLTPDVPTFNYFSLSADPLDLLGTYNFVLAVDPFNSNLVYMGGEAGRESLLVSDNGIGPIINWSDISNSTGVGPHRRHHAFAFDAQGRLLDGNDGGMWRLDRLDTSGKNTSTWRDLTGDMAATEINNVTIHPTDANIAFAGTIESGLVRFNDTRIWNYVASTNGGLGYTNSDIPRFDPTNALTVYAQGTGGFERSLDGGVNWTTQLTTGATGPYVLDPSNPSRILIGTGTVQESTNRGNSFVTVSPAFGTITSVAAAPSDFNTMYAAANGQVQVTVNHGASWTATTPIFPSVAAITYRDIIVDPNDPRTVYVVAANLPANLSSSGTVFRTTNGGTTWTNISGNLPAGSSWTLIVDPKGKGTADDVLYVGGDYGVFTSADQGNNWTRLGTGLPNASVRDLDFNTQLNVLSAATFGRGVWQILPPVNPSQLPSAVDDSYNTPQGTTLVVPRSQGVLANDSDPFGLPLTAVKDSNPANGTLTLNLDGSLLFVPSPTFTGVDSFTYHATNGRNNSASARVTLLVGNIAPVAQNDSFATAADTPITVAAPGVLSNDTDSNGDTLSAVLDQAPGNGTLGFNANGSFSYIPNKGFNGLDTFQYHANDSKLNSNIATVTLIVGSGTGGGGGGGGSTTGDFVVVGADAGGGPVVQVFDAQTGNLRFHFLAYDSNFMGGVRVATGDVNGDGTQDIITVPGPGGAPLVRVFDGRTAAPISDNSASFFAFDPNWGGGVNLAAGDVDDDGKADIITGADVGGAPLVAIYSGATGTLIRSFLAYDAAFGGGVRVSGGDVNADGFVDVIAGAGPGGSPHVMVFSGRDNAILQSFQAFDPAFAGGIYVAGGDVNGDGRADIVTGAGAGGAPHVRTFDGTNNAVIDSFFAFDPSFAGGVRVGTADVNNDGRADLLAAMGPGGATQVQFFDALSASVINSVFAFEPFFQGGLFVNSRGR